jgi:hypothetical protein
MSGNAAGDGHDDLQFDSAVPAAGAVPQTPACAQCKEPINDYYYEVAGHVTCARCKGLIETKLGLNAPAGAGPMARAVAFGAIAAVAGAAIYLAVAYFLHIEFALIAILVGYMVGRAVRYGSGGRGGRRYQLLALGMTYLAISVTYVPAALYTDAASPATPNVGLIVLGVFVLLLIAPIKVVLTSFPGSILTALIVGFGLQQAWRMNRRTAVEFKGPFKIGGSVPGVVGA